ncbi:hypothetical protein VNO78_33724 [Psophocarpus tetragonolobus]|uniref:Uncharacterized protein n=1 Tax=Psophocarpus tetragonolobus TaxID=3891 RepID=A0AAN9NXJ5_PSOTE
MEGSVSEESEGFPARMRKVARANAENDRVGRRCSGDKWSRIYVGLSRAVPTHPKHSLKRQCKIKSC